MAGTKRVFKTTKVLSGAQTQYRAWKDWDVGDVLIGTLKGTSKNRKNVNKVDWIVQVEDAQFSDKAAAKKVIGKTLTLNCAGQLDKGLEQIEFGEMFQVTYNGAKEMKGGPHSGKEAHTMEVVGVSEGGESEEEETDFEEEEENEDLDEDFEDDDDL